MRSYLLSWILAHMCFFCKAQDPFSELKYKNYYSINSLGKIVEIKTTHDSLWIISGLENTSSENIPRVTKKGAKQGYEIVKDTIKGTYHLLIIKRSLPTIPPGRTIPKLPLYSLFAFYQAVNHDVINVLQSDYDRYNTIEQAEKISFAIDFSTKYFVSWYSASILNKYMTFIDLKNADTEKINQVEQAWIAEFDQSRKRLNNFNGWEGQKYAQNILTKSLIKTHLNPKLGILDFSNMLAANHMAIPNISIGRNHEAKLFLDTIYNQPLKINEAPK